MKRRALRRVAVSVAVVAVIVVALGVLLEDTAPIDYYRLTGPSDLVVGAEAGPALWARVAGVVETDTQVIVTVKGVRAPIPSTGSIVELTVHLSEPLGTRNVLDGRSPTPVPPQT